MTRIAFRLLGLGKSEVTSSVLHKARKNNKNKKDIINLRCVNSDGHMFANFDVYPAEAIAIASALNKAYLTWKYDLNGINIRKKSPHAKHKKC